MITQDEKDKLKEQNKKAKDKIKEKTHIEPFFELLESYDKR